MLETLAALASVVLLAFVNARIGWRKVLARRKAPDFRERLADYRTNVRRTTLIGAVFSPAVAVVLGAPLMDPGNIALMLGAAFLAVFTIGVAELGLFRTLYEDPAPWRVRFFEYLRLFAGVGGPVIPLALLPFWVEACSGLGETAQWVFGGVGGLATAILFDRSGTFLLWALSSRPLDPELRAALMEVDLAAGLRGEAAPEVFEYGRAEGGAANAFAVPERGRPRVGIAARLLRNLEREELAAVYAHELAHLGDGERTRIMRIRGVLVALSLLAGVYLPITEHLGAPTGISLICWPLLVLIALATVGRGAQHAESHCDAQAVGWLGEGGAEAMIRGLVKLYDLNFTPRRVAASADKQASHPSLARRIRDLRALDGTAAAGREFGRGFVATGGATQVLFLTDERIGVYRCADAESAARLAAADDVESARAFADETEWEHEYDDLTELRVVPRSEAGTATLRVIERATGRTRDFALGRGDVGRLQPLLDEVDSRVGYEAATDTERLVPLVVLVGTLLGYPLFAAGVAQPAGFLLLMGVMLGTVVSHQRAILAVLGAMVVVYAGDAVLQVSRASDTSLIVILAGPAMALAGGWMLLRARAQKSDPAVARRAAVGLTAVFVAFAAVQLIDLVGPNAGARWYSFGLQAEITFLLAAGAAPAWLCWRQRLPVARLGAVLACAVLALAGMSRWVLESQWFLAEVAQDPFVAGAPAVSWRDEVRDPLGEVRIDREVLNLALSPDGQSALVELSTDAEVPEFAVLRIGSAEPLSTWSALAACWVGGQSEDLWSCEQDKGLSCVVRRSPTAVGKQADAGESHLLYPFASVARDVALRSHGDTWVLGANRNPSYGRRPGFYFARGPGTQIQVREDEPILGDHSWVDFGRVGADGRRAGWVVAHRGGVAGIGHEWALREMLVLDAPDRSARSLAVTPMWVRWWFDSEGQSWAALRGHGLTALARIDPVRGTVHDRVLVGESLDIDLLHGPRCAVALPDAVGVVDLGSGSGVRVRPRDESLALDWDARVACSPTGALGAVSLPVRDADDRVVATRVLWLSTR